MATEEMVTLDVREDLRNGREPLRRILAAVDALAPGQGLRLLTTFEPLPLYRLLGGRGLGHEARRLGVADWEVRFFPDAPAEATAPVAQGDPASGWPAPAMHLDNRGLEPPEPMMRILEALETLAPGEVLAAVNEREPVFLFPELAARGHAVTVERRDDGVHLTIRRGADPA